MPLDLTKRTPAKGQRASDVTIQPVLAINSSPYERYMTAKLLDGTALARQIRAEVSARVAALRQRGIQPGMAVLMAGDDPASEIYVRNKALACGEAGIAVVEQLRF